MIFLHNVDSLKATALRTLKKKGKEKVHFLRYESKRGKGNLKSLEKSSEYCIGQEK